jgi:predicted metal-dependent phosphoesterase TrpH
MSGLELYRELRQLLAELELVSHVSAMNLDPSSRDASEDIGGKRPPGGIDRRDDLSDNDEHFHAQKSVDHFKKRIQRAKTDRQLNRIKEDAQAALVAWHKAPAWKKGQAEPERKSFLWKRMIADSPDSAGALAKHFGVSPRTVRRYRETYAEQLSA